MRQHMVVSTIASSQSITTNSAVLAGMQLGTDSLNDPTVTIYNGTSTGGKVILPTTTYDATALGLNGFVASYDKRAYNGIYVEISVAGSGTVEVTIDHRDT